jgi:S1-C subfamily serine protease
MVTAARRWTLGPALLVVVIVAACGDQQQSPSAAAPTAAPSPTSASTPTTVPASSASPAASGDTGPGPVTGPGESPSAAGPAPSVPIAAASLEQAYEAVVGEVGPSVVLIETDQGLGSGVVLDDKGDVVTNAHVVEGANQFKVVTPNGDRLDATLVGAFPSDDIAVIRAKGGAGLKPAAFANSDDLKVGEIVLAIGNPLGLQSSVTDGIISAVGRTVNEDNGVALPGVIQTSAPINPGNSGGALVDLSGEVVGIPTLTATDPQIGGAASGIGFAIPSNIAKDIGTQLVQNGKVVNSHRAYLGVRLANVTGANGAYVYSVDKGGPADKAGIPADVLITEVNGTATPDQATLASVLAGLQPGLQVAVKIEHRDGSTQTKQVTLGELPG